MIKTSRIKFTKVKAKRQRRWRMPVLFIFLILFVGIIVFAQNNTADHDDYPSYTHDSYVHINADEYGYISIMPYYIDYDLHWHDASVALLFSQDEWDKESIEINLPDGWQYTVGYNQEIHDYYYWVPLMVFDYEDNEYQQLEKIAVIITFPDYMEPVISTPYEYEYDQEPDYNYEYGYDFEDHGYLGEAPDYALYSQYIGIMPLANFFVTFDNNDGGLTDPSDFAIRSTLNNGTIGAVNMPSNPERPGHRFFMWSRHQDGFGSIANDPQTGYIFNGSSIVTAGLNPFTVYAQWGYPVSFNCNYTTLVKPSDVYALSNSAQYGNRWVHLNRTHAQSNALSWTPAQPWPANPVNHNRDGNTFFFVGWYTMSGGNYIQRFDTNTVITGPTQLYARWSQRVLQFNPRDGITEPQDFARHYLYGTAAALSLGAGNRPPNPTHPNGYRFMGWTRTALGNGTGTAVSSRERFLDTDTFTLANSVPGTVFAQWGHQLTFDGNGTTLNILAIPNPNNSGCYSPRIVASGQSLSWIRDRTWGNLDFAINTTNQIIWPAPPTRENYVFGGWFTRENGEYNQHITDATPVFGDMTLYARWIHESEFDGRFVVFDPQNGTPSSEFIKVETLPAGNIGVDAWPTPNPVYLGHHFMAWTRTPDGSGTATGNIIGIPFNSNSVVAIGESPLTIYAQWAHRVSFDINGGTSAVPVTRYYRAGMSALESNALMWTTTVAWPANPVNRATHSFIGWYTRDGSDGYEERFYAHTPIHSDIVLYARWAERGVTFNLNDGGVTPADEFPWRPLIGTGNANVGAANWPYTPIYPGPLHFLAWTRTQDGGGSTAAVIPTTNFTIAEGSPTIFAQWGHRVTFDGDEHNLPAGFEPRYVIPGTSIAQTNTHPWITTTMPGIPPLRRGFNFVGWFEFGSNDMFTVDTIVNNDITLFARWEPLRVYFDPIDGVTLQPQFEMREFMWNGTLGAANVPDAPPPLADGRIFMNWVRPPSPQGSAGTTGGLDSGIFQWTPVSGATWIHAIESPLMAEARYGWIITFNCALSGPLPQGTTINQFSPRIVYNGHSATETNALTWTASTIIWPNPPSQPTMTFLGWYTKDSSGNYEQRVDAATQITNHMELHARWITRRVIFNPRDGITQEQDFEYRMLTDAVNAAMIGAMPENSVSPRFDGLHFIVYTRTEAGLGTATGTADREHIITGTLFPLANPPMVFGQWGHRIQFHGNGVAAAYHTRYVFPGATLAQSARIWNAATWPANPIVTSRVFLGWYTRDSLGNYESEFIFDPNHIWTGDLDLYARWDIGIVIFDPQDGTAQSTWETRELLGDNTVGEVNMPVPTRDGYRFMAWTRTDDGVVVPPWTANTTASTRIQFIGTATVTFAQSPHTVYAQWGHQVNFDAGPGASLGANSNTRVIRTGLSNWQNTALFWTPGAANVSAWPNNPVRTGYSFYGWYTRIGGAYAQRVDAHTPLDSSMVNAGSVNGDITLFARWIPTINMYVDFNPNDGGATLPSDFHRGQTNATGSVIAANFAPVPTWGNRIFLGWTRTQDGTGSIIGIPDGILFVQHTSASNTSTITAWESIFEVFAQWAHTITFNGNGVNLAAGTGVTGYGPRHISIGRNVAEHNALVWTTNITWPNPPVRGGYDFSGWYTRDSNGDFEAWFDATTQITDDLTLHAMWTVPYVHYHTNGGLHVGSVDPNYVHMRRVGPTPPPPTRTGYSFVAWTRTQSGDITPPWTNHTTAQSPSHAVTWGATSTVPVGMFPFSVYAQWGNRIDFNSGAPLGEFGGVAVGILPNHTNSNAVTGYGHRIIATGRTLPEHNFFAWSTNVIWPNNPTRLDSPAGFPGQRYLFNGWRITHNNQINGNFMGYFCPVNTVLYRNLILFAEWIPEEPHTVTFDMTHGVLIGENQSNIRRAWHNQTVCASSNVNWSVATRLNTNVAWPRSAPNVIRDVPVPMTVASWWTEPSGPYGDGVMWSRRGWNSGNNINGSATTPSTADTARWEGPATMTAVTEDITVFPNWVYRITFHPNGGNTPTNAGNRYRDIPARWCSNTLAYLPGNLANNGRHPNDSIQRNFAPQPTRTNHIFVGWWSEPIAPNVPLGEEAAHGHPNAVEFTLNCMVDRNITVYARWVPFYTPPIQTIEQLYVRFDLNNGGRWWTSTGNQPLPPGGIYGYRTVRVNQGGTVGTSRMP
ncbi:MAG: InlB B-repeat-containing protein, partial [Defluviitaleaceae bacterium]|nr:InlB B-repeat-containing protein [Defluviitaleaceae bacterium]